MSALGVPVSLVVNVDQTFWFLVSCTVLECDASVAKAKATSQVQEIQESKSEKIVNIRVVKEVEVKAK